jgi:hypothetical protein
MNKCLSSQPKKCVNKNTEQKFNVSSLSVIPSHARGFWEKVLVSEEVFTKFEKVLIS